MVYLSKNNNMRMQRGLQLVFDFAKEFTITVHSLKNKRFFGESFEYSPETYESVIREFINQLQENELEEYTILFSSNTLTSEELNLITNYDYFN